VNGCAMHYVIPWSDRLEGLVVCAVSGGERVRYALCYSMVR